MISFLSSMLGDLGKPASEKYVGGEYRAALDALPLGIAISDATKADHPVLYTNPAFCRITGYPPEEILGRNLRLLQGPGTEQETKRRIARALSAREPVTAELVNYRRSGEAFWMRVQISPVKNGQGRVTRYIGLMCDVTENHQAAESLRSQEERLRSLVEAIPLPMLIFDAAGRIGQANPPAHAMLQAEQLGGRPLSDFLDIAPLLEDARLHGDGQGETLLRTADGRRLWVLASCVRCRQEGRDVHLLVFMDIGRLKEKELELARAYEEAERTIRAKSRFFAAASHDLRQPLQALALFSSALEMHVTAPAAQKILQSIKLSLSTMEEMFDALLDMSRLEAGVLKAAPEEFLVKDVLERLEMEFAPLAARKGLTLRVVPSSATVRTDPALLNRILRNFLSNAVRYTQSGRILLGCRRRGSLLAVEVADTGPGIAEDQRLAIFGEFFQGGPPSQRGGAQRGGARGTAGSGIGLGLSIVQGLARLLGHRLEVRSRLGHGSTFAVLVPLAETPAESGGAEDDQPADLAGARVLVVDDDPAICEGLRMLLEDWGCRVIAESSGDAALTALQAAKTHPDLILSDIRLANADGIAVLEQIQDSLGVQVPAFLFTGDEDIREVRGGAGRSYPVLHKPLNPLHLRTALAEALGEGRKR